LFLAAGTAGSPKNLQHEPPPESEELSVSVLRYLNLRSEEFYLRKKKFGAYPAFLEYVDNVQRDGFKATPLPGP
jgi:hypothetical protein